MMRERLEAIRQRAAAATEGPWEIECEEHIPFVRRAHIGSPSGNVGIIYLANEERDNAEFVIHAREDIPWLLERVAALEAENAQLREAAADLITMLDENRVSLYGAANAYLEKARRLRQVLDERKDGEG